jgi:hypothetical protein
MVLSNDIVSTSLGNIGKIIITKEVEAMIDQLHHEVGNVEWSGILFYNIIEGKMEYPKDLVIKTKFLYPLDIGTAGATSFKYDGKLVDAFDICEDALECDMALIHSHNSMSAFFSGTDEKELKDNSANYNYYLSLVVCFDKEWVCKVAIPSVSKVVTENTIKNSAGKPAILTTSSEEKRLLLGDLTVEFENKTQSFDWLSEKIKELKVVKPTVIQKFAYPKNNCFVDTFDDVKQYYNRYDKTPAKKPDKVKSFLTHWITLNDDYANSTVLEAISVINDYAKDDSNPEDPKIDMYKDLLLEEITIVYDEVVKDPLRFKENCKLALTMIKSHKQFFMDEDYYDAICDILKLYV